MNSLSLYLHFPFCRQKCAYCDFYSRSSVEKIEAYEESLAEALVEFAPLAEDRKVETVYVGGGTPSLATPKGIEGIFAVIKEKYYLSSDAEITVEMNPESATDSVLSSYKKAGVNRISFGMQSSHSGELSLLGRIHTFDTLWGAFSRARAMGFENISLDLMYGLPDQSVPDFLESLEKALSLSPDHLSFYLLTLSPDVPLSRLKERLPDEECVREMYLSASRLLESCGFEHYEISNAAKEGKRSRHNLVYWSGGEYLGLGPGAHSYFRSHRFEMAPDLDCFLSSPKKSELIGRREEIDLEGKRMEYIMLSLRIKEGIDFKRLCALSDPDFVLHAEKKFSLWETYGLCKKTDRGYALTPEGFFVSNEIITELI